MAEMDGLQPDALVDDYALRLLGERLDRRHPHFSPCVDALAGALPYHCRKFAEAGKAATPGHVLQCLARGEFAFGRVSGCDWVEDVLLATLMRLGNERVLASFPQRFSRQLRAWQRLYASDDPDLVDDFLTCLLLPRPQSPPRICGYLGQGPFGTWLREVFRNLADHRRRERRGLRDVPFDAVVDGCGSHDTPAVCSRGGQKFGAAFDQHRCEELIAPIVLGSFDILNARERTIVLQAIVDGVPQRELAERFRVKPGRLTHIKQDALAKMEQHFYVLAYGAVGVSSETLRVCLELLLDGLGEPRIEFDKLREPREAAQL